ncbi:MAG TPA: hypothetical protein VGH81_12275 [Rudaea sp.]
MTSRQTTLIPGRGYAGFSMIDVLVAIVVLATALLALAALQGALTRSAADSRARSQIAAYTEGLIEQLRSNGYASVASYSVPATSASCTNPNTLLLKMKCQAFNAQTSAGVNGLSTAITPTVISGTSSAGSYAYNKVNVTSTWTDATGQARTLAMDTIIDSTSVNQSDQTLINKSLTISGASGPTVREYNPAATAGVIPIALGNGDQTAATNPQPEVLGKNGSTIAGVSFNVLTYTSPTAVGSATDQTIIQQHIDTRVISCGCKYAAGLSTGVFAQAYNPAYWDGSKYVVGTVRTTSLTTGVDSTLTQDAYCDVCCRDRNDDGATSDMKYDPFTTTSDYAHYRYSGTSLVKVLAGDTSTYLNACRLIRIDGQYSTTVDMQNYFFGLLATAAATTTGSAVATSAIPDAAAVVTYESFILDYLSSSIASLAAGTGPAANPATTYATAAYTPSDAQSGCTTGLDCPTNLTLSSTSDKRYLHARGLYIDYLEPDAKSAINKVLATCGTSTSDQANCVLPLLPFTTINETELAVWTSSKTTITAANTPAPAVDDPTSPLRGYVTENTADGSTVIAWATIGKSNSGVVGNIAAWAVDNDDQATLTDSQQFTTSGSSGSGTGSGTTYYFNVGLSFPTSPASYNWITNVQANLPTVQWSGTAAELGTAVTSTTTVPTTQQTASPFTYLWDTGVCVTTGHGSNATTTCTPNSFGATTTKPIPFDLVVSNYNKYTENKGTDSVNASDGTACPSTTALQCFNYPITGITITDGTTAVATTKTVTAVLSDGATGGVVGGQQTQAAISMSTLTPFGVSSTDTTKPDLVTINFGTPVVTTASGATCTISTVKVKGQPVTTYTYNNATSCQQ